MALGHFLRQVHDAFGADSFGLAVCVEDECPSSADGRGADVQRLEGCGGVEDVSLRSSLPTARRSAFFKSAVSVETAAASRVGATCRLKTQALAPEIAMAANKRICHFSWRTDGSTSDTQAGDSKLVLQKPAGARVSEKKRLGPQAELARVTH